MADFCQRFEEHLAEATSNALPAEGYRNPALPGSVPLEQATKALETVVLRVLNRDSSPQPLEVLDKYFVGGEFSGGWFERLGRTFPDSFEAADLLSLSLTDVYLGGHLIRDLLETGSFSVGVNALLGEISDFDIWSEDAPEHLHRADVLWRLIDHHAEKCLHGNRTSNRNAVGGTKLSKLLARKRPHLIPITDQVVKDKAIASTWQPRRKRFPTGRNQPNLWVAFRAVLSNPDVQTAVVDLHDRFRPTNSAEPLDAVTPLRMIDALIWMNYR